MLLGFLASNLRLDSSIVQGAVQMGFKLKSKIVSATGCLEAVGNPQRMSADL